MLESLSTDIFNYICMYLDEFDICRLGLCSKMLNKLINNQFLYVKLQKRWFPNIEYNNSYEYIDENNNRYNNEHNIMTNKLKFVILYKFYKHQLAIYDLYDKNTKYGIPYNIKNYLIKRENPDIPMILFKIKQSYHQSVQQINKLYPIKLKQDDLIYYPLYLNDNYIGINNDYSIIYKYLHCQIISTINLHLYYKLGDYPIEFLSTFIINGFGESGLQLNHDTYQNLKKNLEEYNYSINKITLDIKGVPHMIDNIYGYSLNSSVSKYTIYKYYHPSGKYPILIVI